MSSLRSRIWKRILSSSSVLIPACCSIGTGAIAVFTGGIWVWVSIAAGVVAASAVAWKISAGVERLEAEADQSLAAELHEQQELELENLQKLLRVDKDHRTKDCLAIARESRREFLEIAQKENLANRTREIGKQFDKLFWATIEQLRHSVKLYDLADRLVDGRREAILGERENVVTDLLAAVDRLRQVTTQLRQISQQERDVDLKPLTDDLDASLRVAKRVEERLRELENGPIHDEFLKQ